MTPIQPHEQNDPPTYSEDGVDLTLIRWMLSLTPSAPGAAAQCVVHFEAACQPNRNLIFSKSCLS